MVNRIRDLGVDNPIVVMGLLPGTGTGGWTLHGMPTLNDPIAGPSQLVLLGTLPTHRRDRRTGATDLGHRVRNIAASLPVMAGAFNVSSKTRCTKQTPTTATDLVTQYLTGKRVGIAGGPSTTRVHLPTGRRQQRPDQLHDFSCEGPAYTGKFGGDRNCSTRVQRGRQCHLDKRGGPAVRAGPRTNPAASTEWTRKLLSPT